MAGSTPLDQDNRTEECVIYEQNEISNQTAAGGGLKELSWELGLPLPSFLGLGLTAGSLGPWGLNWTWSLMANLHPTPPRLLA